MYIQSVRKISSSSQAYFVQILREKGTKVRLTMYKIRQKENKGSQNSSKLVSPHLIVGL